MLNPPTEPSPLGQFFGLKLGEFDPWKKTYSVEFLPTKAMTNFFRTVHGGALAAIFDETMAMLAYFLHGINSAVTDQISVSYYRPLRPLRPILVEVWLTSEGQYSLFIRAKASRAGQLIAEASSQWQKR
ncbi:MAG: PaaI family thioesterase [Patescibacteria group bacterium]|nr:PaaI family thioesterase [Patescibacteria group bacterium]